MPTTFPFLTAYDPPGTSEGSLDPLGLYQIADQLAVMLVPAIRERMQRIRFLTAMAVGALVTEGMDDDPELRDASPYLVWEWLVVEAIVRTRGDDNLVWGVPGTHVAGRALNSHGYLDARSYLKTPRIFGFNGVYKRLAVHLGLVDVHLAPGPKADALVDAWARGQGLGNLDGAKDTLSRWTHAVERSLREMPPRTRPRWINQEWQDLAVAFAPNTARTREKRFLRNLLLTEDGERLGAFPFIWELQAELQDDVYAEEALHNRLQKKQPLYAPLLVAIREYEAFARSLQDGFDILKAEAAKYDAQGFSVPTISGDAEFAQSVKDLHVRFETVHEALGEVSTGTVIQGLFADRFAVFSEPLAPKDCALALCGHHEGIQQAKSANGKRPWFDRLGEDRIYIRHAYREKRRDIEPDRYLHDYRGRPIRRFHVDLS